MPVSYLTLGQVAPVAATETVAYTVPTSTDTVVSSLIVCNRAATSALFRVGVSVGGGALVNADYLYYDVTIAGNDTFVATVGVTMSATDEFRVESSTANLTFSFFGSEVT